MDFLSKIFASERSIISPTREETVSEQAENNVRKGFFDEGREGNDDYEKAWAEAARVFTMYGWRNQTVELKVDALDASEAEAVARRDYANRPPAFAILDTAYFKEYGGSDPSRIVRKRRSSVLPDEWQRLARAGYPCHATDSKAVRTKNSEFRLTDGLSIWAKFWGDGEPLFSNAEGDQLEEVDLTAWLTTLPGIQKIEGRVSAQRLGDGLEYEYHISGLRSLKFDVSASGMMSSFLVHHVLSELGCRYSILGNKRSPFAAIDDLIRLLALEHERNVEDPIVQECLEHGILPTVSMGGPTKSLSWINYTADQAIFRCVVEMSADGKADSASHRILEPPATLYYP